MRKCFFATSAALLVALMSGCVRQSAIKTDLFEKNETVMLTEGRTDSLNMKISLEYATGGVPAQVADSINRLISLTAFGPDYDSLDVKDASAAYISEKAKDYKESNLELLVWMKKNNDEGPTAMMNWFENVSGCFYGSHGDVTSYVVKDEAYQGGAHGMASDQGVNFITKTGKMITESEYLVPDYKEKLSELLTAHLQDAMPDTSAYNALFIKNIEPNGNFRVSESGLTYVYGQYEIGPYYLGIIYVTVPWEEAEQLLAARNQ